MSSLVRNNKLHFIACKNVIKKSVEILEEAQIVEDRIYEKIYEDDFFLFELNPKYVNMKNVSISCSFSGVLNVKIEIHLTKAINNHIFSELFSQRIRVALPIGQVVFLVQNIEEHCDIYSRIIILEGSVENK